MQIDIPILVHSNFDLAQFDFSFKDIYLYEIQSKEFEEYIRSLNPEIFVYNFDFVESLKEEIHFEFQKYYAIIKRDINDKFSQNEILNVYKILLIIFPSDLQILHELHLENIQGNFQFTGMSSFNERITGEYPGDYLLFSDKSLDEVNEFIELTFDRLNNESYIDLAISHYLVSFEASHYCKLPFFSTSLK